MSKNGYIMGFTILMCSVISFMLAGTSIILKEKQELNRKIDMQKNILISAGLNITDNNKVQRLYKNLVTPININKDGSIAKTSENLEDESINSSLKIFEIKDSKNHAKVNAYVYPVLGQGLWSKLFGFLAVNPKGDTILGLTFYKHGETPGLGAEIEKKWFVKNFIGKKLYSNKEFMGITVAKGKAKNDIMYKSAPQHIVDGISGATITSKGVEKMLHKDPLKYHSFFNK